MKRYNYAEQVLTKVQDLFGAAYPVFKMRPAIELTNEFYLDSLWWTDCVSSSASADDRHIEVSVNGVSKTLLCYRGFDELLSK